MTRSSESYVKMELIQLATLLPPVLAILLVLVTKKPLIGLGAGIASGIILLSANAFDFFIIFFQKTFNILTDVWNLKLIIALFLLGAFIGLVELALYRKEIFSKVFNSKKKVLVMGWITGLFLFIDDYFNILLNGMIMKSFAKKHKISKEKIAFIIHSLGVAACVIIPFSTWTIFVISIVNNLSLEVSGFSLFLQSIPFNFYAISLVLTTIAVIIFEIDLLKMKESEKQIQQVTQSKSRLKKIKIKEALFPAFVLVGLSFIGIIASLRFNFSIESLSNIDFINILLFSSAAATVFGFFYYKKRNLLRKKQEFKALFNGAKQMKNVILIMISAWLLGQITLEAGTTETIVALVESFLTPQFLILTAFLITAITAFMTSSWATFAIMIPVLIPLSIQLGINPTMVLAAIISGGVFGDHMSPISSTTILTKAVSKSEVHEHFHSQLPYAVISFVLTAYLFFLLGTI